jgi:hypothetical protein
VQLRIARICAVCLVASGKSTSFVYVAYMPNLLHALALLYSFVVKSG